MIFIITRINGIHKVINHYQSTDDMSQKSIDDYCDPYRGHVTPDKIKSTIWIECLLEDSEKFGKFGTPGFPLVDEVSIIIFYNNDPKIKLPNRVILTSSHVVKQSEMYKKLSKEYLREDKFNQLGI